MEPNIVSRSLNVGGKIYDAVPEVGGCTGCAFTPDTPLCRAAGECSDPAVIFVLRKPKLEAPQVAAKREMGIPTTAAGRKAAPLMTGLFAYFPDALTEVAALSQAANVQHGHAETHWDRSKSTDHGDCILRHQMEFDKIDSDEFYHAAKVAWRSLAQLQLLIEKHRADQRQGG